MKKFFSKVVFVFGKKKKDLEATRKSNEDDSMCHKIDDHWIYISHTERDINSAWVGHHSKSSKTHEKSVEDMARETIGTTTKCENDDGNDESDESGDDLGVADIGGEDCLECDN